MTLRLWLLVLGLLGAAGILALGAVRAPTSPGRTGVAERHDATIPRTTSLAEARSLDHETILRQMEQDLLLLVNDARHDSGPSLGREGYSVPLVWDEGLAAVARAHSADMIQRGYFEHITPDGIAPAQRITQAGIKWTASAENISRAPDVATAHEGLMQSPGHRANILALEFTDIGIGIVEDDAGMLVVTELFRRAPATELAQRSP